MPIVFVHGVNNRDGEAYRENQNARDGFLKEYVAPALGLKADNLSVTSPYWGEFGVAFAWRMAVLPNPSDEFESFGKDEEAEAHGRVVGILAESHENANILELAKTDLAEAVDLLYASSMAGATSEDEARDLARSYELALAYAIANPHPEWVSTAGKDNFADSLTIASKAKDVESFGPVGSVLDSLKEAMSRLVGAIPDVTTAVAGKLLRKKLNATVTRFAGDAFVYLSGRGTVDAPGPIVRSVLDALREAHAKRTEEDKLVVIAHSFGGEIVYDILTYFDPTLTIDCLITVGSQVGLFEEMKLYKVSDPKVPRIDAKGKVVEGDRVTPPQCIKRWLNVFDTNDILGYQLAPVFDGVSDFQYDTGYSSLGAHGGYFMRPSFYKRLATRLTKG
ncbi:hypothetical protein PMI14_06776 [Acidovorax sp. CF316]|uniref:hypothetical protein n=1 Tax=Acidovorax sp. CF316 TaxID=1144317 RepID=UPI00026BE2E9|nr:hypothetical protein [Acidovorax sp. CF316]EJE48775.1 hypothetical protein PMI14_06776 [Acidovorax sp. CF316]